MRLNQKGRPPGAGFSPSKRRFLEGAAAFALSPVLFTRSARGSDSVAVLDRWTTGNETLFPFARANEFLYCGGDRAVEAWNIGERKRLWIRPLDHSAVFRPRIARGLVVTSGRSQLACRERLTGDLRWEHHPRAELSVPLLDGGRVYIGEGHRLMSLDARSGQTLWAFDTMPGSRIAYAPAVRGDAIFLGAGDGLLYCLSAREGELVWQVDRESDWQYLRQIANAGDALVAGGYHDEIFAISATDGGIIWRFNAGNFINSQLVRGNAVYFWSATGWLYALNIANGSVIWRHRTVDYGDPHRKQNWAPILAELVADDDYLYVLSMDHVLHLLELESGHAVADYRMPVAVRPFVCLGPEARSVLMGSTRGDALYLRLG